jgi:hypothetical protein
MGKVKTLSCPRLDGFWGGGSGGMDPFILDLGTRWKGVVISRPVALHPGKGRSPEPLCAPQGVEPPTIHAVA